MPSSDAAQPAAEDHAVHEAVGPPLSGLAAAAAIAVGVNSLLTAGLFPVLLGALGEERRLSAAGIGQTAMAELLAMAASTALAGIALPPRRLRLIGVLASLALALIDLASMGAAGLSVMALRAAAGAAEGVLLWITVGMISRTVTPERWAAVFFTGQVLGQLVLSVAFGAAILPRWGAAGAFAALALCSLVGIVPALLGPSWFAPLVAGRETAGPPPLEGWVALLASLVVSAAAAAVGVYIEPFALQAGLSPGIARTAVSVSLAAQVAGGVAATALAGRIGWFKVFALGGVLLIAAWGALALHAPAAVFIAANAVSGFVGLLIAPFIVPMTIEADPSRRAAIQSGGAQLLGSAAGPLLASFVVTDAYSHGAIVLGSALLVVGIGIMAGLHLAARRVVATSPGRA